MVCHRVRARALITRHDGAVPSSFRPLRQQRSAATLDRIVKAAQDLLAARALTTEAWQRPDSEFQRMNDELDAHIRDALERLLRARSGEFTHPDPRHAARVGMLMLDATVREAVLFATDRGGPLAVPDVELCRDPAQAYAAYLSVSRAASHRSRSR
jgi:hypothetical protein